MDNELTALLERISQQTGMQVEELIRLAVLEFVHSYDLDFEDAKQVLINQPDDGERA